MKKRHRVKVALIPPTPDLGTFGTGDFHLLLSHLLKDPNYKAHYKEQRLKHGAYLVLDNSAHERGRGENAEKLMFAAMDIGAQEVVVPDSLFDANATVESALRAHEIWYEGIYGGMITLNPALMYVPQGRSPKEWYECGTELLRIHKHSARRWRIKRECVLGISKDYEMWDGGIHSLLLNETTRLLEMAYNVWGVKVHVHLLGWGRDLWKLKTLTHLRYPHIRSTDSAKPFVYALRKIKLDPNSQKIPKYPTRPRGYFTLKMTTEQMKIARHNIEVFKAQVN